MFHYWGNNNPFFSFPSTDLFTADPWSDFGFLNRGSLGYDPFWRDTSLKSQRYLSRYDQDRSKGEPRQESSSSQLLQPLYGTTTSHVPGDWIVTEKGSKVCFSLRDLPEYLDRESVHVSVENGSLCLSGKTKREDKERGFKWKSSFYKSHKLPNNVNPDSAKVLWRDNRLNVEFDRAEDTKHIESGAREGGNQQQQLPQQQQSQQQSQQQLSKGESSQQMTQQQGGQQGSEFKIRKMRVNTRQLPFIDTRTDEEKGMTLLNMRVPEGVKPEDIILEAHDQRVRLSIPDQENTYEEGNATITKITRWMPATWYLPAGVPSSELEAHMVDNNTLQIRFPYKSKSSSTRIGIKPKSSQDSSANQASSQASSQDSSQASTQAP